MKGLMLTDKLCKISISHAVNLLGFSVCTLSSLSIHALSVFIL